ncbi:hypothetical protein ACFU7T_08135 [Streptomyces sp. NPDC057555]|uniref:hypothetical protein n=1 Tax=Streptomyces sp. NPDC057555 TaxID=3346166 RepID=UPI00368AB4E7
MNLVRPSTAHAAARAQKTITDCNQRITQYQAARDIGADPQLVSKWINEAQGEKTLAQHDLLAAATTQPAILATDQIAHMVTELGSMTDRLLAADPAYKRPLYEEFGVVLHVDMQKRVVTVESQPSLTCAYSQCPRGDLNPHAR